MTTSTKRSPRFIELNRRREVLTGLLTQSRHEEGISTNLRPGGYYWSSALLGLLAKNPERFFAETGEPSDAMRILAHCIKGKVGQERTRGFCDAVNTLLPETCSVDVDGRIIWRRGFRVGGELISEIDFFLAYDLLDQEE